MRILWIPHTGWHIPQRAHLFCRSLSGQHEVHVTDWVADFTRPSDYLSRRYLRNFTYHRRRDNDITVHGIPRISPALFSPNLRRINQRIFSRYVQRITDQYQIDVVVGTFLASPPAGPRLVLDIFDDNPAYWREYRGRKGLACEIEATEAEWATKADAIVTVSSVLKDKWARKGLNSVEVIPNAINLERFRSIDREEARRLFGLSSERKVVGFVSRFGEFSGLLTYLRAVKEMDDAALQHLVVGDGELLPQARRFVKDNNLPNVVFTGWVGAEEVTSAYAALDVGVIPFDLSAFTHSAFPIKLLEYLAAGANVVSTSLEEVKRLAFDAVLLADTEPASFAQAIKTAVTRPHREAPDLRAYSISELTNRYEKILRG